ncbi:hypothetical protein TNCV_2805891 [Trichonephila clavipes]|nr:hypothetical protein TNCV_2805891 [Trichonephila clavipes]
MNPTCEQRTVPAGGGFVMVTQAPAGSTLRNQREHRPTAKSFVKSNCEVAGGATVFSSLCKLDSRRIGRQLLSWGWG